VRYFPPIQGHMALLVLKFIMFALAFARQSCLSVNAYVLHAMYVTKLVSIWGRGLGPLRVLLSVMEDQGP
jgi:hypothetical protein